jgi:hypothetical protein
MNEWMLFYKVFLGKDYLSQIEKNVILWEEIKIGAPVKKTDLQ